MEKKFEFVLSGKVTCNNGRFAEYDLKFFDMPYDEMQNLQGNLLLMLKGMGDAKKKKATSKTKY